MDRIYNEGEVNVVAKEILNSLSGDSNIIALKGDLGAGKTTLTKEIARELGINDVVISPTYVLIKFYNSTDSRWKRMIHMDAYRIEDVVELDAIGFKQMLDPENLIIIEWPEKIKDAIPKNSKWFEINHENDMRHIKSII